MPTDTQPNIAHLVFRGPTCSVAQAGLPSVPFPSHSLYVTQRLSAPSHSRGHRTVDPHGTTAPPIFFSGGQTLIDFQLPHVPGEHYSEPFPTRDPSGVCSPVFPAATTIALHTVHAAGSLFGAISGTKPIFEPPHSRSLPHPPLSPSPTPILSGGHTTFDTLRLNATALVFRCPYPNRLRASQFREHRAVAGPILLPIPIPLAFRRSVFRGHRLHVTHSAFAPFPVFRRPRVMRTPIRTRRRSFLGHTSIETQHPHAP